MGFLTLSRDRGVGGRRSADELRFERGQRTLADEIAPFSVDVEPDALRIDGGWARVLVVTDLPRRVMPGFLNALTQFEEPIEVTKHIHPLETPGVVRSLNRKLNQYQSSRNIADREGRPDDPERETAFDDAESMRDVLQRGEGKAYSLSLYVLLRAPTRMRLDAVTRRVEGVLEGMLASWRCAWGEQDSGLHAVLPEGDDRLRVWRNIDTAGLAYAFPFTSSSLSMGRGILYGTALHNLSLVILDPFDDAVMPNANGVVFAPAGSGKSFFVKVTSLRSMLADSDVFVIDPEGEYRALCEAVGGQYVRLGAGSDRHINPLDMPAPPEDPNEEGAGLDAHIQRLIGWHELALCAEGEKFYPHERALIDRALRETYADRGITADFATHGNEPPLLEHVAGTIDTKEGETARALAYNLRRYTELSLAGMFNHPTNVDPDARLIVFDVKHVGADLLPLAIQTISDYVWGQLDRRRRQRLLVIDELWTLLRHEAGGRFLEGLARRSRKRNMGVIGITQQIKDFLGSDQGLAVLEQSSWQLLMRQKGGSIDAVVDTFNLSPYERQFLLGAERGEGLFCVGTGGATTGSSALGGRVPIYLEASPMEYELATTAPRDLEGRRLRAVPDPEEDAGRSAAAGGRR